MYSTMLKCDHDTDACFFKASCSEWEVEADVPLSLGNDSVPVLGST